MVRLCIDDHIWALTHALMAKCHVITQAWWLWKHNSKHYSWAFPISLAIAQRTLPSHSVDLGSLNQFSAWHGASGTLSGQSFTTTKVKMSCFVTRVTALNLEKMKSRNNTADEFVSQYVYRLYYVSIREPTNAWWIPWTSDKSHLTSVRR